MNKVPPEIDDDGTISNRVTEAIQYSVEISCYGKYDGGITLKELPAPFTGEYPNGRHPHPLRCVSCGEEPYPPYSEDWKKNN